jgi:adenylyltransferase/sulfurtransferase
MAQAAAVLLDPPTSEIPPTARRGEAGLSRDDVRRYCRHLVLPEIGFTGQKKLMDARVLCIGTGGLGSPVSLYLAAAGIGHLGLVDTDAVDFSNLQRQVIHFTPDVGTRKVESAYRKLRALNPSIEIVCHDTLLTPDNALEICSQYDVIVDASDNFATRYVTNDACVLLGKPNVYACIFRFEGQASVFYAKEGPCYRCLYPEPPEPGEVPSGAELGILGVVPGIMGLIQATEVMKLILGIGNPLIGRLMMVDALEMRTSEMHVRKNPDCPACGNNRSIGKLDARDNFYCFAGTSDRPVRAISPQAACERSTGERANLVFLDVREPSEWSICRIEGAKHIPLSELDRRLDELDPTTDMVVYCLTGARSKKAINGLAAAGFANLWHLKGGLRAWAQTVDPEMWIY